MLDLHVHPPFLSGFPGGLHGLRLRLLARSLGRDPGAARARFQGWLQESRLTGAVLLALDRAHDRDGRPQPSPWTGNDAVADLVAGCPKGLFGASVHPWRKDAVAELERLLGRGARLLKWIPSVQGFPPDDPACRPLLEALAHHRVPLLVHAGVEHTLPTLPGARQDWNHPRRLVPALRLGVTVIVAHCALALWLYESDEPHRAWRRLALEHEHCYGDLSALVALTRARPLARILERPELAAKLVYGSDFPVWTAPTQFAPRLGWSRAWALGRVANPLDRAAAAMAAFGVPEAAFHRGHALLRCLP